MDDKIEKELINAYTLGDMQVRYLLDPVTKQVDFLMIPGAMEKDIVETKFSRGDSLVQLKILGDMYAGTYAGGSTMRNSYSVEQLKYEKQDVEENNDKIMIRTFLKDERGYTAIHELIWYKSDISVEVKTSFINDSDKKVTLEMLSSFSMGEITPFIAGDAANSLILHRIRSKWSHEGRYCAETFEDLQLEPSWVFWQSNNERFGQLGSMPVKKYFPFMAVEDTINQVLWGVQLAHEASWQLEVYRRDDGVHLSGGIADREFGHWMKHIMPGERFTTPTAILSVCQGGGINHITQRLTQAGVKYVNQAPKVEQSLPILFNEYCTTWGLPSHENISKIVEAVKGKGLEYFVIDCGWFNPDGKNWGVSMGDYEISSTLFPEGLAKTVETIKNAGMKPGIWFEIDNIGCEAKSYYLEEHLLKRDGIVLTTGNRRFWDMRDPWVQNFLEERVIGQLKEYGFEYIKMDYNDTIGIGCDGAESLGEGLRQNMEASVEFVRKIKAALPNLVIENCASGGHKLEPLMMSLSSMASFSDAHECEEIPIIAANLHRTILPRQSQIWAVIRKDASLKRIAYVIANTFLGRMCFSGDVTELTQDQWTLIEEGMEFYRTIAPVIKDGYTYHYGPKITSERYLEGWQGIVRIKTDMDTLVREGKAIYQGDHKEAYVLIHVFYGLEPEYIEIKLPEGCPDQISKIYSDTEVEVTITDGVLRYKTSEEMKAIGIYLNERIGGCEWNKI